MPNDFDICVVLCVVKLVNIDESFAPLLSSNLLLTYEDSFNSLEPRKYELATTEFVDKKIIFLEREAPTFW